MENSKLQSKLATKQKKTTNNKTGGATAVVANGNAAKATTATKKTKTVTIATKNKNPPHLLLNGAKIRPPKLTKTAGATKFKSVTTKIEEKVRGGRNSKICETKTFKIVKKRTKKGKSESKSESKAKKAKAKAVKAAAIQQYVFYDSDEDIANGAAASKAKIEELQRSGNLIHTWPIAVRNNLSILTPKSLPALFAAAAAANKAKAEKEAKEKAKAKEKEKVVRKEKPSSSSPAPPPANKSVTPSPTAAAAPTPVPARPSAPALAPAPEVALPPKKARKLRKPTAEELIVEGFAFLAFKSYEELTRAVTTAEGTADPHAVSKCVQLVKGQSKSKPKGHKEKAPEGESTSTPEPTTPTSGSNSKQKCSTNNPKKSKSKKTFTAMDTTTNTNSSPNSNSNSSQNSQNPTNKTKKLKLSPKLKSAAKSGSGDADTKNIPLKSKSKKKVVAHSPDSSSLTFTPMNGKEKGVLKVKKMRKKKIAMETSARASQDSDGCTNLFAATRKDSSPVSKQLDNLHSPSAAAPLFERSLKGNKPTAKTTTTASSPTGGGGAAGSPSGGTGAGGAASSPSAADAATAAAVVAAVAAATATARPSSKSPTSTPPVPSESPSQAQPLPKKRFLIQLSSGEEEDDPHSASSPHSSSQSPSRSRSGSPSPRRPRAHIKADDEQRNGHDAEDEDEDEGAPDKKEAPAPKSHVKGSPPRGVSPPLKPTLPPKKDKSRSSPPKAPHAEHKSKTVPKVTHHKLFTPYAATSMSSVTTTRRVPPNSGPESSSASGGESSGSESNSGHILTYPGKESNLTDAATYINSITGGRAGQPPLSPLVLDKVLAHPPPNLLATFNSKAPKSKSAAGFESIARLLDNNSSFSSSKASPSSSGSKCHSNSNSNKQRQRQRSGGSPPGAAAAAAFVSGLSPSQSQSQQLRSNLSPLQNAKAPGSVTHSQLPSIFPGVAGASAALSDQHQTHAHRPIAPAPPHHPQHSSIFQPPPILPLPPSAGGGGMGHHHNPGGHTHAHPHGQPSPFGSGPSGLMRRDLESRFGGGPHPSSFLPRPGELHPHHHLLHVSGLNHLSSPGAGGGASMSQLFGPGGPSPYGGGGLMGNMPKLGGLDSSPFYRAGLGGLSSYPGFNGMLGAAGLGATPFGPPPNQQLPSFSPKKSGRWNAMHVRISWEIYQHQQKGDAKNKDGARDTPSTPSQGGGSSSRVGGSSTARASTSGGGGGSSTSTPTTPVAPPRPSHSLPDLHHRQPEPAPAAGGSTGANFPQHMSGGHTHSHHQQFDPSGGGGSSAGPSPLFLQSSPLLAPPMSRGYPPHPHPYGSLGPPSFGGLGGLGVGSNILGRDISSSLGGLPPSHDQWLRMQRAAQFPNWPLVTGAAPRERERGSEPPASTHTHRDRDNSPRERERDRERSRSPHRPPRVQVSSRTSAENGDRESDSRSSSSNSTGGSAPGSSKGGSKNRDASIPPRIFNPSVAGTTATTPTPPLPPGVGVGLGGVPMAAWDSFPRNGPLLNLPMGLGGAVAAAGASSGPSKPPKGGVGGEVGPRLAFHF